MSVNTTNTFQTIHCTELHKNKQVHTQIPFKILDDSQYSKVLSKAHIYIKLFLSISRQNQASFAPFHKGT